MRKILIILFISLLITTAGFAQKLSIKEIKKDKGQIVKLQKEINRLNLKLKKAKGKQLKADIKEKIALDQTKIKKLKNILYPKPKNKTVKPPPFRPPTAEAIASLEAGPEENISKEAMVGRKRIGINYELGAHGGVFAGTTGFFVGARAPLGLVLGPAVAAVRLSAGLTQTMTTDRRYVPVCLDLVFNFPPGWFSGVENYLGGGLNYTAVTSGRKQGTFGGELFYGVQSEGFGGIVFGELGFAILRSGSAPSSSGLIVMVGFREPLGF
jgi:hypothetical protein